MANFGMQQTPGFDWMGWLSQLNQGQPGGGMAPQQMPQAGGMPQAPQTPPMPGQQPAPGSMGPGIGGGGTVAQPQQEPLSARDQAMMGLYADIEGLKPQEREVTRGRALAQQLRAGAAMPQMRDPTVASHPLEFLSSLAHTGASAYAGSKADAAEDAMGSERSRLLKQWREGLGFKQPTPGV